MTLFSHTIFRSFSSLKTKTLKLKFFMFLFFFIDISFLSFRCNIWHYSSVSDWGYVLSKFIVSEDSWWIVDVGDKLFLKTWFFQDKIMNVRVHDLSFRSYFLFWSWGCDIRIFLYFFIILLVKWNVVVAFFNRRKIYFALQNILRRVSFLFFIRSL